MKPESKWNKKSFSQIHSGRPKFKVQIHTHGYPERSLGWKKFARHGTSTSQFYTHQSTTFWRKQNFLTRSFFSIDQLVVLPYKAKWHLRGQNTKGSTFLSDRTL